MITSVNVANRKAAILLAAPLFAPFSGELNLSSQQAFHTANQAWMIWAIWWLAMAFFSKSTKRRESVIQRIEHLVPAFLGFLLIFRADFGGAWLARPVFSANSLLLLICVVATILGLLFAVWARLTLGSNWSGTVTIKSGHNLIRRGPYRWIRHPIYTGLLISLVGTLTLQGEVRAFLGFAFALFALYRKAKREEQFLSDEFGEGFAEHTKQTGMFLPRFG